MRVMFFPKNSQRQRLSLGLLSDLNFSSGLYIKWQWLLPLLRLLPGLRGGQQWINKLHYLPSWLHPIYGELCEPVPQRVLSYPGLMPHVPSKLYNLQQPGQLLHQLHQQHLSVQRSLCPTLPQRHLRQQSHI